MTPAKFEVDLLCGDRGQESLEHAEVAHRPKATESANDRLEHPVRLSHPVKRRHFQIERENVAQTCLARRDRHAGKAARGA